MPVAPGSKDRSFITLDFIINILKEHGQILDKSIHSLGMVTEQIGDQNGLKIKMEIVGEKINLLQKKLLI
jgi:hypothetical protein